MAIVMIGVDPHKGSHTAVAIGSDEERLGQLRVRASASQAQRLVKWAVAWPQRTWAVEGAGGLGHLLAQQLVAAGGPGPDVPPQPGAPGPRAAPPAPKSKTPTNPAPPPRPAP